MSAFASTPNLPRLHPAQLRALRQRLQNLIRDAGRTDPSPDSATTQAQAPFWQLEPDPLIISASEWTSLEAALIQRARLVNALLVDVYNHQEVLRAGILPPEIVLGDPYYRRPCLNLEPKRQRPAMLLRFDLVKTKSGWNFIGTKANTPIGLSYAVQNRRFLTQEAGDYYGALPDYHSIINFPLQLLDALHQLSPRSSGEASAVVLTAGPHDPYYSEHSFLARKMGLPLARGDDLLVLDNCVYFKTIAGLERIDVIYRRLNDAHIDPVAFTTRRETAGIPGLLQCIRNGNVTVANAIGTGFAESRAIDAYLPALMRFYFGEKPLLSSIPTYICGDNDQLDYILDSHDRMRVRPAHDPVLGDPSLNQPPEVLLSPNGLSRKVLNNPYAYVAQDNLESHSANGKHNDDAPRILSAFALAHGNNFTVMPGGLVAIGEDNIRPDRIGHTTDAVVLHGNNGASNGADVELGYTFPPRRALGSHSAESLMWLGRYLERAEATARMLSIFDDVALEEIPANERARWLPVWRGLLEATGHAAEKLSTRGSAQATLSADLAWRMALDNRHPSSIFSSVGIACENARQLRDYVSPEAWVILSRLQSYLTELHHQSGKPSGSRSPTPDPEKESGFRKATQSALNHVITDINAFLGTAERTMLQDPGWHFLHIGLHLERAIMTCGGLRHVLGGQSPMAPSSMSRDRLDTPELSALLRMLGSQDAYRRIYQTRSRPRLVAELFIQQPDAPRSIFHNLHRIKADLHAIQADIGTTDTATSDEANAILQFLASIPLDQHFNSDNNGVALSQPIDNLINDLLERLYALHALVSDHYFSHQAKLPTVYN